eukprot:12395962-Ditylum_brightwellii.AAC.1
MRSVLTLEKSGVKGLVRDLALVDRQDMVSILGADKTVLLVWRKLSFVTESLRKGRNLTPQQP